MDEFLHKAFTIFQEHYKPAGDLAHSTHLFSTSEIHTALTDLNPGANISKDAIFELLEDSGYT